MLQSYHLNRFTEKLHTLINASVRPFRVELEQSKQHRAAVYRQARLTFFKFQLR